MKKSILFLLLCAGITGVRSPQMGPNGLPLHWVPVIADGKFMGLEIENNTLFEVTEEQARIRKSELRKKSDQNLEEFLKTFEECGKANGMHVKYF